MKNLVAGLLMISATFSFVACNPLGGGTSVDEGFAPGVTSRVPSPTATPTSIPNTAPLLAAIADVNVAQSGAHSADANDSRTGNDLDPDGEAITYTCRYDTNANGSVGGAGTLCTALLNLNGTNATFNAATGAFAWTLPANTTVGATYEFEIIGTDPSGASDNEIWVVTVTAGPPAVGHSPAGDRVFPSSLAVAEALSVDFVNSNRGDDTGMTYACVYDQVVDGAVAAGTACTSLPGTVGGAFNTSTGVLTWTPSAAERGSWEIKVTGTSAQGTDDEIFLVTVREAHSTTNLLTYFDSWFATGSYRGINSPLTTTWQDLANTGSTYDGTLTGFAGTTASGWTGDGATTITTAANGPYRLAFDGTDYVDLGTGINAQTDLLFDLWMRPTSFNTASRVVLNNVSGANGFSLAQDSSGGGKLVFTINATSCTTGAALNNSFWHHVAGSYVSGTDTLKVYLNGTEQCSVSGGGVTLAGSATSLTLGAGAAGANAWSGAIGSMKTYSAVNAGDVATNFAASSARFNEYVPMSNMRIWLRADAITGLADGASVSNWPDTSGNGNHGTQATANEQPTYESDAGSLVNGKPVVRFYGNADGQVDSIGLPSLAALTEGHAFMVIKLVNEGTGFGHWWFGASTDHFPWSDGTIYDGFGSSARKTTGNPVPALTSWRIYEVESAPGNWTSRIDGTQFFTTAVNTVSFSATPRIGRNASTHGVIGDIPEFILYSQVQSVADRQRVQRYLGAKYGITVP